MSTVGLFVDIRKLSYTALLNMQILPSDETLTKLGAKYPIRWGDHGSDLSHFNADWGFKLPLLSRLAIVNRTTFALCQTIWMVFLAGILLTRVPGRIPPPRHCPPQWARWDLRDIPHNLESRIERKERFHFHPFGQVKRILDLLVLPEANARLDHRLSMARNLLRNIARQLEVLPQDSTNFWHAELAMVTGRQIYHIGHLQGILSELLPPGRKRDLRDIPFGACFLYSRGASILQPLHMVKGPPNMHTGKTNYFTSPQKIWPRTR